MLTVEAGPRVASRLPEGVTAAPYERFEVSPLTPLIGAEIAGVRLGPDLEPGVLADLRRALLEWKVLFFRDQRISGEEHRGFAGLWGELEIHPFLPAGEVAEVVRFEKGAEAKGYENIWHSDVSWRQVPSLASVLRAVDVPTVGGDTLWCDMAAAYDGLPEEVKDRIDGLRAVHDFSHSFGRQLSAPELEEMRARFPAVDHPVVRRHPETGRRTLYVNAVFTSHITGMSATESDELLDLLCRQASVPEYQCRFRWSPDAVAFWDNRATQHYAASDYWPARRVMERATVIGDVPA